jgi:hypothetical protein
VKKKSAAKTIRHPRASGDPIGRRGIFDEAYFADAVMSWMMTAWPFLKRADSLNGSPLGAGMTNFFTSSQSRNPPRTFPPLNRPK